MNMGQGLRYLLVGTVATVALQAGAAYLGPVGIVLNLIVALPAACAVLVAGLPVALLMVVLSTLALGTLSAPVAALGYVVQNGLGPLVLATLLKRGFWWGRASAVATLVVVSVAAALLVGYAGFSGQPLSEMVAAYIGSEVAKAMDVYRQADLTQDQLQELESLARRAGDFFLLAYPGFVTLMVGLGQLVLVRLLAAAAKGRYVIPGPLFMYWRAPESLIWGLILGGFGGFFAEGVVETLALNLLVVLVPVYFLQGLAICSHLFARKSVPPLMRAVGFVLITLVNPLTMLVTAIGVFDLWADFRKPRIRNT